MSKFKVGDKVEIVMFGQTYSTYNRWAEKAGAKKWRSGYTPVDGEEGIIVSLGKHLDGQNEIALVDIGDLEIVIDVIGIKLINNKTNMNLKQKFSTLFASEPKKSAIKAGLLTSEGLATQDGLEVYVGYQISKDNDFKKEVVDALLVEESK